MSDKEKAEFILSCAEVEKSIYRLGLSRVFFRAGTLAKLDRQVEESTHDVIVQFQVSHIHSMTVVLSIISIKCLALQNAYYVIF